MIRAKTQGNTPVFLKTVTPPGQLGIQQRTDALSLPVRFVRRPARLMRLLPVSGPSALCPAISRTRPPEPSPKSPGTACAIGVAGFVDTDAQSPRRAPASHRARGNVFHDPDRAPRLQVGLAPVRCSHRPHLGFLSLPGPIGHALARLDPPEHAKSPWESASPVRCSGIMRHMPRLIPNGKFPACFVTRCESPRNPGVGNFQRHGPRVSRFPKTLLTPSGAHTDPLHRPGAAWHRMAFPRPIQG